MNQQKKENIICRRSFSQRHKDNFLNAIHVVDWQDIYCCTETNIALDKFHLNFKNIYDKNFPILIIKPGYRNRKPWLTDALRDCIRTKNKLYALYKKD